MFSATRSITIPAPPEAVLEVVADPQRLPEWAPAFASAVRPEPPHWRVASGDADLLIDVRVCEAGRSVDFVAAGTELGVFTRVLPNEAGAEFVFTRFFGDDAPDADEAAAMAVVEDELRRVRDLSVGTGGR